MDCKDPSVQRYCYHYQPGDTYLPSGPMPCTSVIHGGSPQDAATKYIGSRRTTTTALVSAIVDNYGTTFCNGQVHLHAFGTLPPSS